MKHSLRTFHFLKRGAAAFVGYMGVPSYSPFPVVSQMNRLFTSKNSIHILNPENISSKRFIR